MHSRLGHILFWTSKLLEAEMKFWQSLVIVLGSLINTGCGQPQPQGTFEVIFRNDSTQGIWVESAKILKADIGCGALDKGIKKELVFPKLKESPPSIDIEWWEGGSRRPSSKDVIFNETIALPNYAITASVWRLNLVFDENQKWNLEK